MNYVGLENEFTVFLSDGEKVISAVNVLSSKLQNAGISPDLMITGRGSERFTKGQGVPSLWLASGGRIYMDRNQLEYASPECRSVKDLVLAEKAGDMTALDACGNIGGGMNVYLLKRSASKIVADTHTWGSHENYSVPALLFEELTDTWTEHSSSFVPPSAKGLVLAAYLASRQIFSGSGHVGYLRRGWHGIENRPLFFISPRMEFIKAIVSSGTTGQGNSRPLINTKNEPWMLGKLGHKKRLHLIVGDMNRSDWSVYLKVGVTALVLEFLRVARIDVLRYLCNACGYPNSFVDRAKNVSLSLNHERKNRDFYEFLDIQHKIKDAIADYKDEISENVEEFESIFSLWCEALDAFSGTGRTADIFSKRTDFFIRKNFLEKVIGAPICDLHKIDDNALIKKVLSLDFSYGRINKEDLYRNLVGRGEVEEMFGSDMAKKYCFAPPDGRAAERVMTAKLVLDMDLFDSLQEFGWGSAVFYRNFGPPTKRSATVAFDDSGLDAVKLSLEYIRRWATEE